MFTPSTNSSSIQLEDTPLEHRLQEKQEHLQESETRWHTPREVPEGSCRRRHRSSFRRQTPGTSTVPISSIDQRLRVVSRLSDHQPKP